MAAGVVGFCCGNLVFTLDAAPLPLVPTEDDAGPGGGPVRGCRPSRVVTVPTERYRVHLAVHADVRRPAGAREPPTNTRLVRRVRRRHVRLSGGTWTAVEPSALRRSDRDPVGSSSRRQHTRLGMAADDVRGPVALRAVAREPEDRPGVASQSHDRQHSDPRQDPVEERLQLAGPGGRQLRRVVAMRPELQRLHPRHRRRDHDEDRQSRPPPVLPVVTSDGTMYFVRSGRACGAIAQLVRRPPGGPGKVVAPLPWGQDISSTYALENADGTTSVLFGRSAAAQTNGTSSASSIPRR